MSSLAIYVQRHRKSPGDAFQFYINVLDVLKDIASSTDQIEARLVMTMPDFTTRSLNLLLILKSGFENANSSLVFECRRAIFRILVTCLHQANHFADVRLDGKFLSRHVKVLEKYGHVCAKMYVVEFEDIISLIHISETMIETYSQSMTHSNITKSKLALNTGTKLRIEFSRPINRALCQNLKLRSNEISSACLNTVIFDIPKLYKHLDMSDTSKLFHRSLNALLVRSLNEEKKSTSTCTQALSTALDVFTSHAPLVMSMNVS